MLILTDQENHQSVRQGALWEGLKGGKLLTLQLHLQKNQTVQYFSLIIHYYIDTTHGSKWPLLI